MKLKYKLICISPIFIIPIITIIFIAIVERFNVKTYRKNIQVEVRTIDVDTGERIDNAIVQLEYEDIVEIPLIEYHFTIYHRIKKKTNSKGIAIFYVPHNGYSIRAIKKEYNMEYINSYTVLKEIYLKKDN